MKFEKDLIPFRVAGVYNSVHIDKSYQGDGYFVTQERDHLEFALDGIVGERHRGFTTTSGGRFTTLYERGTQVRNNRMWSAISPFEVSKVAENLILGKKLTPELLGINLLLEGMDTISDLPQGSYLVFSPYSEFKPKREENVTLVVYGQALPCTVAGKALVEPLEDPTLERRFPKAAMGLRGTTGWVEKAGIVRPEYYGWVLTPTGKD
ncbi:hypothetical protein HYV86_06690 [Candidatus Woesearchaeota archaeon]|nr:hypothetical protein [Candidatus Woesearchaeota archaeon]